jgi:hypothetical protein
MAKAERRSRSAMMTELIRRYARIAREQQIEDHPLVRSFSDEELDDFLKEDRKASPKSAAKYRKLLGLT